MRTTTILIVSLLLPGLHGCAKKAEETEATAPPVAAAEPADMKKPEESAPATKAPRALPTLSSEDENRLRQTVASSFGKGTVKNAAGVTYTFQIEGSKLQDDSSYGKFRFYSFQGDGKLDVSGNMTCVHINSADRQLWMAGEITTNISTSEQFTTGDYAEGGFVYFRARPNSMKEQKMIPGAIEIPTFGDAAAAAAFCKEKSWSAAGLIELSENDLIAAIP